MQFDAHVLTQKHNLRQQLSCIDFSDLPLWRSCCLAMTVMVVEGDVADWLLAIKQPI